MENVLFTLNLVAPVFFIIFLGLMLKIKGIMSDEFPASASSIIYKVALPAMVFLSIAKADFRSFFDIKMLLIIYGTTLSLFLILWLTTGKFIKDPGNRGVFQQGSWRGNYAIIGFAIIESLYGATGLAKAAILLAFILPLNNILAIIVLSDSSRSEDSIWKQFFKTLTHPLILSVFIAIPFSLFEIKIPYIFLKSGSYLSTMVLPVALLAIGASLHFEITRKDAVLTAMASGFKLIIFPAAQISLAAALGFRGEDLGVLAILWSVPTAVVSYIMAEGMGSNGKLAASIVAISTVFSIITISAVILIGRFTGLY